MTVTGLKINKKGDEVRSTSTVEGLVDVFEKIKKGHKSFKDSVKPLDQKISKRYQSVGIEKIEMFKDKETNTKYYQFSLHYILREKRNIRFANVKMNMRSERCKRRKVNF